MKVGEVGNADTLKAELAKHPGRNKGACEGNQSDRRRVGSGSDVQGKKSKKGASRCERLNLGSTRGKNYQRTGRDNGMGGRRRGIGSGLKNGTVSLTKRVNQKQEFRYLDYKRLRANSTVEEKKGDRSFKRCTRHG